MSRQLSVVVVGVTWPLQTFLQRLFRGLARRGVTLWIGGRGPQPDDEFFQEPGIHWYRLPPATGIVRRLFEVTWALARTLSTSAGRQRLRRLVQHAERPRSWRSWWQYLERLLPYAARRWDVVYCPWNSGAHRHRPLFDLAMGVVSCRGSQIKIAPLDPEQSELAGQLRASFAAVDAVHCVSQDTLETALCYGADPARSKVIAPAVDVELFQPRLEEPARSRSGPFRIVAVGSLVWVKGFEFAVHAIGLLRDQGLDVVLELIGEGSERQRVLYTVDDLGLGEQVELLGSLKPPEVRSRLQQADAFLLSSISEGISNAALEAMACGLPVVSTDCGGMREAITDGVEGLLVPSRNAPALAEALRRLIQEPRLAREMGRVGRRRVERDFQLEQQIDDFLELFHSTLR